MSMPRMPRQVTPMQYRRRRTFALLVLILLIWGVVSGFNAVSSMFSGATGATPGATQASEGKPCATGAIKVQAKVGDGTSSQSQFSSGSNPKIWFTVTNIGSVACTFNVGSSVQSYKITSGTETIWDSKQCDRTGDKDAVVTVKAGETLTSPTGEWMRVYSSASGCGAEQVPVIAGGASYHLSATVNQVISTEDPQFILN